MQVHEKCMAVGEVFPWYASEMAEIILDSLAILHDLHDHESRTDPKRLEARRNQSPVLYEQPRVALRLVSRRVREEATQALYKSNIVILSTFRCTQALFNMTLPTAED